MEDGRLPRLKELTETLREAAYQYYQNDTEILSNYEYDALYDELARLEKELGTVLSGSPTQQVGYEVRSALPKVAHEKPMLSLDKTKEPETLKEWLGDKAGLLSWKMDGLTVVLKYTDGSLTQAVTRGNGEIGEEITANARVFRNVPLTIPYTKPLTLRGEAVMSYDAFDRVNEELEAGEQYKNPRNLCSGTVRQLDSRVTAKRGVFFIAFGLVQDGGEAEYHDSKLEQLAFLRRQGFDVVETVRVDSATILDAVADFEKRIADQPFPSDGLVLTYESLLYSQALGTTQKFPRDAIAFKWQDETARTRLLAIEWNTSRTGLINPVAVFEPVELEGTTVRRASLHNVSILEDLRLGIGDTLEVYKANMIIPQIAKNLTRSGTYELPGLCPRCGGKAEVEENNDTRVMVCTNPSCPAKLLMAFTHFVSRDAMNIEGLSEATLERLIGMGVLERFGDLYRLHAHRDAMRALEGFGERSVDKLLSSIEASRNTELYRLVYALGILNVGVAGAKSLCRYFGEDLTRLRGATAEEIAGIEGFGAVTAESVVSYFSTPSNQRMLDDLAQFLTFRTEFGPEEDGEEPVLRGMQFVITGSLTRFANRRELESRIESLGGKTSSSVSAKTTYLINNNAESSSAKNKKARELGVPILSEEDFCKMIEGPAAGEK